TRQLPDKMSCVSGIRSIFDGLTVDLPERVEDEQIAFENVSEDRPRLHFQVASFGDPREFSYALMSEVSVYVHENGSRGPNLDRAVFAQPSSVVWPDDFLAERYWMCKEYAFLELLYYFVQKLRKFTSLTGTPSGPSDIPRHVILTC
ncbi:hypothetical protein BaRGS_00016843, partial [Batillaria attramentaria]